VKFAREGATVAGVAAVAALVVGALFGLIALTVGVLLAVAVLMFFRDPERTAPADPSAVVSPADGRVVFAEANAQPHRFAPGSTVKVAIFMSPLDVHVNRSPVDGMLEKVDHRPGRFGAAYRADAGDINESNSLLLRTAAGAEVVVVQIAGWLARRIICRVRPPVHLSRGERVRAGQTTLAWLEATGAAHETQAA